jgi:cell division protein ZapA
MNGEQVLTTVTIFGGEYRIKGPSDPEYARSVARFVDERMREVADRQGITSPARVAILTLLNIADELQRERRRADRVSDSVEERSRYLSELIAAAVDGKTHAAKDPA